MKHLITLKDITTDEFNDILKLAIKLFSAKKNYTIIGACFKNLE